MKYLLYYEYLIRLNTSLKKQGAKIAKYVGILCYLFQKTICIHFKTCHIIIFSDICSTFAG
ncbi:hypothetical protein C3V43_03610 [Bacteroides heparinolyticus]|uniref:Uncharacterized protein n=1 Tax=Prevotella heparinolytica TaxID=28113 RepID=A0A2R3MPS2_9BACE|nr:hypothetical protein C3V43_03610 [Bacteroides heparinolyticus]RRD90496.1 hypothetical protein EII33_08345 [Bacteroides heparinolyticus]